MLVPHEGRPRRDRLREGRPGPRTTLESPIRAIGRTSSSPTASGSTRSSPPSPRPPGPTTGTVWRPGGPSTGSAPGPPRSSPTGSGGTCTRRAPASSTWVRPGHRGVRRARAKARGLPGKLAAGWTGSRSSAGFPEPPHPRSGGGARGGGRIRVPLGYCRPSRLGLTHGLVPALRGERGPANGSRRARAGLEAPAHRRRSPLARGSPARSRDLYRATRCLGRYFTDADPSHRGRISPSATPRFRALPPRHAP